MDEFPKIGQSTSELFKGHHQGLLACVKSIVFLNEF